MIWDREVNMTLMEAVSKATNAGHQDGLIGAFEHSISIPALFSQVTDLQNHSFDTAMEMLVSAYRNTYEAARAR
jgi:hypothetical protein